MIIRVKRLVKYFLIVFKNCLDPAKSWYRLKKGEVKAGLKRETYEINQRFGWMGDVPILISSFVFLARFRSPLLVWVC